MILKRWSMMLTIGLLSQAVFYIAYPFIYLYWRLVVFKQSAQPIIPVPTANDKVRNNARKMRDEVFCNNEDTHGALTHFGFIAEYPEAGEKTLTKLVGSDGRLFRQYKRDGIKDNNVSGDVVVSWAFAYSLLPEKNQIKLRPVLKKVADHYIKYLGTLSGGEYVSVRCNNVGINICPDSEFHSLGQPCAGPQFYTTSSLLVLAKKHLGIKYAAIYYAHYLLFGGWLFKYAPVLYTKTWKGGYVRDITMKALYVHKTCGVKSAQKIMITVNKTMEWYNPLFAKLLGGIPIIKNNMNHPIDAFWFQTVDGKGANITTDANYYINQWLEKKTI